MKLQKSFMAIATFAIVALLSGCTTSEPSNQKGKADVSIAKNPEFVITSGSNILFKSSNAPTAPASAPRRAPMANTGALTYNTISYTWESPIDIFDHFPEFITPEGYYDDFLFESNGEPFDLVMLYANGGYRHLMGIYWYENGVYQEQQLWDEREESISTWVNFNGSDSKGAISRKSDNAGAYTIQLPKGTKFGFFCHSLLNGEEIKEGIHTPLPFGPLVDYTYLFYTEKQKNWSYMVAEYDKYAEQGKTTTQAMTTSAGDWTIVGFEDMSITRTSCDRDYNDCVFAMNPRQRTENEEPPVKPTPDCVEVNLSVNDEHENGDYIATKLSIHVRSITDVEVFLPIDKQYYCLADDMDISLSHREPNMVYNTDPQYVETTIAGTKVTFSVRYEDEGIYVTTDGINQEVIDYCAENYGDGITFEVWNYFKDITREDLKPMLDLSTVSFLDANPALYINAFAKVRGFEGPVYSKLENGQLFPYTDEECTMPLDQQYWTRVTPDAKDYVFVGYQNPWDCVVKPAEPAYEPLAPVGSEVNMPDYNVKYSL